MEQGHENQAWTQSPELWNNGGPPTHQIMNWPGGIDRVTNLIKGCEESRSSQMNTDTQVTIGRGPKKTTPARYIAILSSIPPGDCVREDEGSFDTLSSESTYFNWPLAVVTQFAGINK
eukprot:7112049-Heterocapsa_arctica.AAC.1